ncbi:MAG: SRPBCC family protein [Candidatus Omnitrophica bacterium]|nr:SRPBCC family protein [Candidatus Omnitrophota bacterium]
MDRAEPPRPDYHFVTHWRFGAPLPEVWERVYRVERWPEWWKGVQSVVELQAGDAQGIGSVRRFTWRGVLPFRMVIDVRIVRVEPFTTIEGVASGTLEGRGLWRFSGDARHATVRCDWDVRATEPWMRVLAPLARPLFVWNHDVIMRRGARGLARALEGTLKPDGG